MILMIDGIESVIQDINKLIEQELFEEAYEKYKLIDYSLNRVLYIDFGMRENEKEILAEFYSSYAYFLFSFAEYDEFFKMYIKAQKCGYSSEDRRKFIYESFIDPNIEDFKQNYDMNIKNMKDKGCIEEAIEFDKLPYWLITTGIESEYYLYEKETDLIKEKITLGIDYNKILDIEITEKSSDYFIMNDGCWDQSWFYIRSISKKRKKTYLVTKNLKKTLSYFQGYIIKEAYLDMFIIFKDTDSFKIHFINNSHYLPRSFIGNDKDRTEYDKLIQEIHKYRLSKEGRHGDNILLSICIPSYNRGKKAYENVIHTLKSELDEEIEIISLNNANFNDFDEYYEKINSVNDSRLSYFEFKENKYFHLSLLKVLELANGKYALLLSDEDLVNLKLLKNLINILNCKKENISLIRTKTDGQGIVPYIGMTEPGEDSLFKFMLTSNYMSGCIYNKEILNKHKAIEWVRKKVENEDFKKIGAGFCYPHMILELFVCQYGHVLGLDMILINEGESVGIPSFNIDKTEGGSIPINATLKARLNQHQGFYEVIMDLEICRKDPDILRKMYIKLCQKTIFLVNLTIDVFYKERDYTTRKLLEETYNFEIKYLEKLYEGKKKNNEKEYWEDFNEIKLYYDYYSNIQ